MRLSLMEAVRQGNIKQVLALREEDAKGNFHEEYDSNVLIVAARRGDTACVRLLLDWGIASVNDENNHGMTALQVAVQKNNYETAEVLLKAGAEVNWITNFGAALCNVQDEKMICLLLDYGADVNLGCSPCYPFVGADTIPLMAAPDLASMRLLLERGANVNGRDGAGCTALMRAVAEGNRDRVELLLAAGADVNMVDYEGWTALTWAKHIENEGWMALTWEEHIENIADIIDMIEQMRNDYRW
jgi:uncharacterized protein